MEEKLERLNGYRLQYGFETEIDGGVTFEVLESLKSNLPDVAVAGSSVFSAPDPKEEIARLTRSF
jgi:pentose-5-phosphate-3-epimerase